MLGSLAETILPEGGYKAPDTAPPRGSCVMRYTLPPTHHLVSSTHLSAHPLPTRSPPAPSSTHPVTHPPSRWQPPPPVPTTLHRARLWAPTSQTGQASLRGLRRRHTRLWPRSPHWSGPPGVRQPGLGESPLPGQLRVGLRRPPPACGLWPRPSGVAPSQSLYCPSASPSAKRGLQRH